MAYQYNRVNATRLMGEMELHVLALQRMLGDGGHASRLAEMLKDGGFPETESLAFKQAMDAAQDAFNDLHMSLLIGFDNSF